MNILKQNILDVTTGIIAHGVNCQRTMGSGIAKAIRDKWPQVYDAYALAPIGDVEMLGQVRFVTVNPRRDSPLCVANCYTQFYYGQVKPYRGDCHADYEAIASCYRRLFEVSTDRSEVIHSVIIGSGLAGGNRDKILGIMDSIYVEYPLAKLSVYEL